MPLPTRKKRPRASRVKSGIRVLWLAASILAVVTPRLSAEITLVSRLSDARAFAHVLFLPDSTPPPQIQTDFLPANLSNSAMVSGEPGVASAHSTSNSSIVVDNLMGTLQVTGDGMARADAFIQDSDADATAKLIVISFTLTDRTYTYSLTGQLSGALFSCKCTGIVIAKLIGSSTIFEVVAGNLNQNTPPEVTLSEIGVLPPGNYTLSIEIYAGDQGGDESGMSSANFNFALDPAPTPTPAPTRRQSPLPAPPAQALNLSTRLFVQTGDGAGIGGFIISWKRSETDPAARLGPFVRCFRSAG